MEKRIEVLKNKYKLDIKKYESITDDLLMTYKNIQGIYFIYSDVTEELYIGKSINIGQRIQQYKSNTNYAVKDLLKKNPYLYIIKLNRLNMEDVEKLQAFLIYDTSLASKDRELKLLNIEYNPFNLLYEGCKLDGKLYEKYNSEAVYNQYNFYVDAGLISSTDIVKFTQISNTSFGINMYKNFEYLYNERKSKEEEKRKRQEEKERKFIEKIEKQIEDVLCYLEKQLDEVLCQRISELETQFKNMKYICEKEIAIKKIEEEKFILEVQMSSVEKTTKLLEEIKVKLRKDINKKVKVEIEDIESELISIEEKVKRRILIIKNETQNQITKIKNNLIKAEEIFRESERKVINYKENIIAEVHKASKELCYIFANNCDIQWHDNSNLESFNIEMFKDFNVNNTIDKKFAQTISNDGNLYVVWKQGKRELTLIDIRGNYFYSNISLKEIVDNKLNYKIKKIESLNVQGLKFNLTLEASALESKFYAKYENINIAKIDYNEYIELIDYNKYDDLDVQENRMIEEIEVDEDEDLLDDMNYDDFDYSNDDYYDYEF